MIVGINCGHTVSGTVGSGAVGFLNESNETRRVGYKVMEYLRAKGVTVVDCTDDYSSTVSENLKKIVDKANAQPLICSFRYTLTAAAAEELRFIPITEKFLNKRSWYVKIWRSLGL